MLHSACYGPGMMAPVRLAWPDGLSAVEQPVITIAMFELIDGEIRKEAEVQGG